jgi:signal transduction histidine kinase
MRLAEDKDTITLEIADNGKGFKVSDVKNQQKRGFGLMNMKERIEIMGGHFEIEAAPQEGVKIKISIPIRGPYEED